MAAGPLLNALRACLVTDAEERELLEADLDPAAEGSQEVWRVWETLAEPWVSLSSSQCDDVTCPSAAASSREADDTAVTLKGHVCGDGLHPHQTHQQHHPGLAPIMGSVFPSGLSTGGNSTFRKSLQLRSSKSESMSQCYR